MIQKLFKIFSPIKTKMSGVEEYDDDLDCDFDMSEEADIEKE